MAEHRTRIPPEKALLFFKVPRTATLRQLNSSYRVAVNKFHPDHNPDRQQWATDAMVKINAAYDSAVEYLGRLRYAEVEERLDRQIKKHDEFVRLFEVVCDGVLDGIFTFYQYGLENPHIRTTGTPRQRFRKAAREIATGLEHLSKIKPPNPVDRETLEYFVTFVRAFQEVMEITRIPGTPTTRDERSALNHYMEGSRLLDSAIKRAFFREELTNPRDLAAPQSMAVSLSELMTVVVKYSSSSWIGETALKLCLHDAFQQLFTIEERIPGLG